MYRSRYKVEFLILIVCIIAVQNGTGQYNEDSKNKTNDSGSMADGELGQDACHHHKIEQIGHDLAITPSVLKRLRSMGAIPAASTNSTCIRIRLHPLLRAMHLQSFSALTFDLASNQIMSDLIGVSDDWSSQYVMYCHDINMESLDGFVSPTTVDSSLSSSSSSSESSRPSGNVIPEIYRGLILSNVPLNHSYAKYPSTGGAVSNFHAPLHNIHAMEYLSWTRSHLTSQLFANWMQDFTSLTPYNQLKHLDVSNNQLTNLTWQLFDRLLELRALNLSHNSIGTAHIQYKLFHHRFTQLQYLDLSNNKIMSIVYEKPYDATHYESSSDSSGAGDSSQWPTDGFFVDMPNLHELHLSHNQIADLPRKAFVATTLPKLHVLNLAHNQLSIIPFQVFQSLHALKHLDLSYNRLVTFLDNFFIGNQALAVLNLRNNSIDKILKNSLYGLRHLIELDLSENHITAIDRNAFDGLTALQELNLCQNNLTAIPTTMFQRLLQLKYLNLSRNRFKVLPNGVFASQIALEWLIIDETSVSRLNNWVSRKPDEINKDALRSLRTILMRNNRHLQEIDPFTLHSLSAVEHLDLSGNRLRILPPEIGELKMLNYLDISNNELASMTKQLNTLPHLQTINMLGNSYECDCQMVWLTTWMNVTRQRIDNATKVQERPPFNQLSSLKCRHGYPGDFLRVLQQQHCFEPIIVHISQSKKHLLHSDAQLECSFSGNPVPDILWLTPQNKIIPYYSDPDVKPMPLNASRGAMTNTSDSANAMINLEHRKKLEHHILKQKQKHINFSMPFGMNEVTVLDNGSLRVHNISHKDSGLYICYGYNVMGYTSAEIR